MHLIYHNHLLHNIFTCRIIKFVQVPARFELKTCRLVAVADTYSTEQDRYIRRYFILERRQFDR